MAPEHGIEALGGLGAGRSIFIFACHLGRCEGVRAELLNDVAQLVQIGVGVVVHGNSFAKLADDRRAVRLPQPV